MTLNSFVKPTWHYLFLLAASGFLFYLAFFSPVTSAGTDPHFSLIVSQSLLENGTLYVDAYKAKIPEQFAVYESFQLREWQGNTYYRYPLGSSIFSVPIVWLVNRFDERDMLDVADNHQTQDLISALTVVAALWLVYALSRAFLDRSSSLAAALLFVAGSSLISTMGAALWSVNFLILFELLILWLLVQYESGRSHWFFAPFLGLLLFAAFFTRPTAVLFIAVVLLFLFLRHRAAFWPTAVVSALCLLAFILFSWQVYGQWLPPYYASDSWIDPGNVILALYGLLVSPSRGLLIYNAFFLVTLVGSIIYFSELKRKPLFWLALFWFGLHLLLVASTRNWWGGYSYGPRLLTDSFPALFLISLMVWQQIHQRATRRAYRLALSLLLLLGGWSLYLNSYQGLFNLEALRWNGALPPDVDRHPEIVFQWRYPQFLVSGEMICARNLDYIQAIIHQGTPLAVIEAGDVVQADGDRYHRFMGKTPAEHRRDERILASGGTLPVQNQPNQALFAGWGPAVSGVRRSVCSDAHLFVRLGEIEPTKMYRLSLLVQAYHVSGADVFINDAAAGHVSLPAGSEGETAVLLVPGSYLQANHVNHIRLQFPAPWQPHQQIDLSAFSLEP